MPVRRTHGLAAGAVALAVLVAAPAIGVTSGLGQHGKQPPQGTVTHTTHAAPVPKQPAPGIVTRVTHAASVPKQPVNRHQVKAGPPVGLRHSRNDKGVKGLQQTRDHGKKNLPAQRDTGRH